MYGYKNLKWAIVSGRMEQYRDGTVEYYPCEYDNEILMVRWINGWGINCVTSADNFIEGTYEELKAIIDERERIHQEKVNLFYSMHPLLTNTEKLIVDYMIGDGYEPEEMTYREVKEITQGSIEYMAFNNCLLDAYMDFVH